MSEVCRKCSVSSICLTLGRDEIKRRLRFCISCERVCYTDLDGQIGRYITKECPMSPSFDFIMPGVCGECHRQLQEEARKNTEGRQERQMEKECKQCKWLAICLPLGPEKMYETHVKTLQAAIDRGETLGPCCEALELKWKAERESRRGSEQRGNPKYR
jgi:hypothetical protein